MSVSYSVKCSREVEVTATGASASPLALRRGNNAISNTGDPCSETCGRNLSIVRRRDHQEEDHCRTSHHSQTRTSSRRATARASRSARSWSARRNVVDLLLVAALAQGHVLIEGPPGSAKTLLGRAMAHVLGAKFKRIQFTPERRQTRSSESTRQEGEHVFLPGPVFATSCSPTRSTAPRPKTQAALLEAMQERTVTVGGETLSARPSRSSCSRRRTRSSRRAPIRCPRRSSTASCSRSSRLPRQRERDRDVRLPHTGRTPDMLGDIQSLLGVVGLDHARTDLDDDVPEEVAATSSEPCGIRGKTGSSRRELTVGDPSPERLEGTGPAQWS